MFKRAIVFGLGYRLSNHITTKYAGNFGGGMAYFGYANGVLRFQVAGRHTLTGSHAMRRIYLKTIGGRPVSRFQDLVGHNTFLGGQDPCFDYL